MPGVLVGVIATDLARFTLNASCLVQLQGPPLTEVKFAIGGDLSTNRNNIIKEALERDKDYVFFCDDDMVFPPDILTRLLKHEEQIVASLYVSRHHPFRAMAFTEKVKVDGRDSWIPIRLKDQPPTGLIEVVAAGTAGMLVDIDVFKELEYDTWFDRQDGGGDDIGFCNRATEAGFPIFLDLEARMGHIGIHVLFPEWDENWTTGITIESATIHIENADDLS